MRVVALLTAIALGGAATTVSARPAQSDQGCNTRLKGLKTLSDPQRKLVNLVPSETTIAAINALPQPHSTPKTRSTKFSRQVWTVPGQIIKFKLESDGDLRLVLYDDNGYLSAAMPAAGCIPKNARDRMAMIATREQFVSACGQPSNQWKALGAVGFISGVGFFDVPRTGKPAAGSSAELHPVTGLKIVSGC